MLGELVPLGGGDPIPLLKTKLLVGRRESCDIVLRYANVSAHHCQLHFEGGYLFVRDLGSSNGIKINDVKTLEGRLDPGDTLCVAKHSYRVDYAPSELGAIGPPPSENRTAEIMGESLLSRAGLQSDGPKPRGDSPPRRYDPTNNSKGQIKLPNQPK
jgi:adenylate cyclase